MSAREELVEKLCKILKQEDSEWKLKGIYDDGVLFRKKRGFFLHDTMLFVHSGQHCIKLMINNNYPVINLKEDEVVKLVYGYTSKYQEYIDEEVLKKI